ncbi:LacI family DNA-binding transcriptional regulator [Kitasatospora sp. NPDC006697]|uniref:LacI family DNA-binding transcriptional regulator n=1 Tax=Kitasatospora sp. NPDC006697 TaxID=3364020 RepID=UPI0036A94A51
MGARVTIRDVAARAGVSAGAVSLALNGRPGVSAATKERILAAAGELGWTPSQAARSLAGAATGGSIGLMVPPAAELAGLAPVYMAMIGGIESVLAERHWSLLLHTVRDPETEAALYRQWWQSGRVSGCVLPGVTADDPRIPALHKLGMPAVALAHPSLAGPFPAVWADDAAAMAEAVRYLAVLGHRRIARVGGPARLGQSIVRAGAFEATARELDLVSARSVTTDLSAQDGARATRSLLAGPDRPTAIIYGNDIMAVAGLAVAAELGLRVPGDCSMVAWDDSDLSRITRPQLSAMSHDPFSHGAEIARCLLELLDHGRAAPRIVPAPVLVPRGTTGPPTARI